MATEYLISPAVIKEAVKQERLKMAEDQRQKDKEHKRFQTVTRIFMYRLEDGRTLHNSESNLNILDELLGPSMPYDLFVELVKNPTYRNQLAWDSPAPHIDKKTATELALAEFKKAAFDLESFADNEANFHIVASTLGAGLTAQDIVTSFHAGGLSGLAPASYEEVQAIRQQKAHLRAKWLATYATPTQLRQAVREEAIQHQWSAAEAQILHELENGYQQQVVIGGMPPLPDTFNGAKLDHVFIKKCDKDTLRQIIRKWGSAQTTARLRQLRRTANGTWVRETQ